MWLQTENKPVRLRLIARLRVAFLLLAAVCAVVLISFHTVKIFFILYFFGLSFQPKGYKHKQLFFLLQTIKKFSIEIKYFKTFNNGSLGSRIDEERSELR